MTVLPDYLNDVRYWLRHNTALSPILSGRVFFHIPDGQTKYPLIRMYRAGGGLVQMGGETPLMSMNISLDCWHNVDTGYTSLRLLVQALEAELFTLPSNTTINPSGSTVALDAVVTNALDSPDPALGWPRYVVDTRWVFQPPR